MLANNMTAKQEVLARMLDLGENDLFYVVKEQLQILSAGTGYANVP